MSIPTPPTSKVRVDRGRTYNCTEDILVKAHGLHLDGLSIREVVRRLHHQTFYATPKSFAMALYTAFKARRWEIRPQGAATARSNVQRTFRPQCSHIAQTGPRKGQRCLKRAVGDGGVCWHHDPENIAAGVARLRAGAAR